MDFKVHSPFTFYEDSSGLLVPVSLCCDQWMEKTGVIFAEVLQDRYLSEMVWDALHFHCK